jgi:hypothetical protein
VQGLAQVEFVGEERAFQMSTSPRTASAWALIIDALADLGRSEIERRARQSSGDPAAAVAGVIGPTDGEANNDKQHGDEAEPDIDAVEAALQ